MVDLPGCDYAASASSRTGAGLVARRVLDLLDVPAGFDTRDLRIAPIRPVGVDYEGEKGTRFYQRVVERIRERTGLEAVLVDRVPLDRWRARAVRIQAGGAVRHAAGMRVLSPGALTFLGAELVRGRDLSLADRASVVINDTLAQRLGEGAARPGATVTLWQGGCTRR